MNKVIWSAIALLLVPSLSGCAMTEDSTKSEAAEEKIYVTGSNLPKRDRSSVSVISKEAMETSLSNSAAGTPTAVSK